MIRRASGMSGNQCSFRYSSWNLLLRLSTNGFSIGFPLRVKFSVTPRFCDQSHSAILVISLPMSRTNSSTRLKIRNRRPVARCASASNCFSFRISLQLPEPLGFRHGHPTVLGLPAAERVLTDAVPPAHIACLWRRARLGPGS